MTPNTCLFNIAMFTQSSHSTKCLRFLKHNSCLVSLAIFTCAHIIAPRVRLQSHLTVYMTPCNSTIRISIHFPNHFFSSTSQRPGASQDALLERQDKPWTGHQSVLPDWVVFHPTGLLFFDWAGKDGFGQLVINQITYTCTIQPITLL